MYGILFLSIGVAVFADSSTKSKYGVYRNAAVADDIEICSEIGTSFLHDKEASVVDAAIVVALCNGVINQQNSGLGGGLSMIIHDRPEGSTEFVTESLNGRERAPAAVRVDHKENYPAHNDTRNIMIPSELYGLHVAHQKYGRLPWAELFAPAIKIAREGWKITDVMAFNILHYYDHILASGDEMLIATTMQEDGITPRKTGEIMTDPILATTLEEIAQGGVDSFYNGYLADKIVMDIQDRDGFITFEDLSTFPAPEFEEPVKFDLGDKQIVTDPQPSGAPMIGSMLQLLSGYNYTKEDIANTDGLALLYHRFAEIIKMYKDRGHRLGNSLDYTTLEMYDKLQDPSYAERLRLLIDENHARNISHYFVSMTDSVEDAAASTSHFVIYGEDGAAVSLTTSVGNGWGCKMKGQRTGLVFNSHMNFFDDPVKNPFPSNYPFPGRLVRSVMSPTMVLNNDGDVLMAIGGSGSSRIVAAVVWTLLHNLIFGTDIVSAIDMPRIFVGSSQNLYFDEEVPKDVLQILQEKGHVTLEAKIRFPYLGVVQAVERSVCVDDLTKEDVKCLIAVADYRKNGKPDGY